MRSLENFIPKFFLAQKRAARLHEETILREKLFRYGSILVNYLNAPELIIQFKPDPLLVDAKLPALIRRYKKLGNTLKIRLSVIQDV